VLLLGGPAISVLWRRNGLRPGSVKHHASQPPVTLGGRTYFATGHPSTRGSLFQPARLAAFVRKCQVSR
jgi:hypothetical protein